jgi:hypothetical protein
MANNIQSAELMLSDAMVSGSTSPIHRERSIALMDPRGCRDTEIESGPGQPRCSMKRGDVGGTSLTFVLYKALDITVPAKDDIEHLSPEIGGRPVGAILLLRVEIGHVVESSSREGEQIALLLHVFGATEDLLLEPRASAA